VLAVLSFMAGPGGEEAAKGDKGASSIYEFTVKDIDGKDVKLDKYKGHVLLVVNVASKCGFTDKSYSGMEEVYKKYKDKGLRVLAFPANNFGAQEPGTNAEIKEFCSKKSATFDLFSKISVTGDDQAPLYKYLTNHSNKEIAGKVEWNFQKYLVGRDGTVIAKYGPKTMPNDEKVTTAIEKALASK